VTGEVLFDTTSFPLIFEPHYLRVKTSLPLDANLYGLGEYTESLRLPTENIVRTLRARDSPDVPRGPNLYSIHPTYFEHRTTGTHDELERDGYQVAD
jgi:alpha-glucosidase